MSPELALVMGQFVTNGFGDATLMKEVLELICFGNDWFGVTFDFDDYVRVQKEVDACWQDRRQWLRRSILSTAGMGGFSSDRAWGEEEALNVGSWTIARRCGRCVPW